MLDMKQKIFFVLSVACLLIGGALVVTALPSAASEADVTAARQAQADWSAQRSHAIINRKPWGDAQRPADASGIPLDSPLLLGGLAALLGAAAAGFGAVRAGRY